MGEPKFQAGDVVRVPSGAERKIARAGVDGRSYMLLGEGGEWDEDTLTLVTPAPDPVRDEARKALEAVRHAIQNGASTWPCWPFIRKHMPDLADAWGMSGECFHGPAVDAIVAKLAELAGVGSKPEKLTGESLRKRREALGLSMAEAANLPGLEPYTARDVKCWEANGGYPGAADYDAALTAEEKRRAGVEAPEKVATWDAESHSWRLIPSHPWNADTVLATDDRRKAERWGYRIVGGPEQARCPRCLGCKVTITGFDDVAHACHVCGGSGKAGPERTESQPETWHDRLVRLAREAKTASAAADAAWTAFNEAASASAILAAGGGE